MKKPMEDLGQTVSEIKPWIIYVTFGGCDVDL
jgi:hypothetical protein